MVLLALSLTSACGQASEEPAPTTSPSAAGPSQSTSRVAPTSPSPSVSSSTGSPSSGKASVPATPLDVVGTVSVKQGDCLLFTPGDMARSWVLTGAIETLQPSHRYTLTGTLGPIRPECPQGQTFDVTQVEPVN